MRTEIPYNFMPAEQHFNSPRELLDAVGHYQQTRSFADGDERFNAPEDKFEQLLKEDGGFVLMPIARDYAFLFRGQGGFHHPCLPISALRYSSPCVIMTGRKIAIIPNMMTRSISAMCMLILSSGRL